MHRILCLHAEKLLLCHFLSGRNHILLTHKQGRHAHVFIPHVVVVLHDGWDALLLLRHLRTKREKSAFNKAVLS